MTGKKYILRRLCVLLFIATILIPFIGNAQIVINEIQYNPSGTDGGYEWFELYNTSTEPFSIEGFTFRESDKNHRLVQTNESLGWSLSAGGFAVVADNPTKFFEKHPGFPGLLFDSSFTLVNTGELLEILNTDDELVFGFEYNSLWGGNGDGSTLGLINSIWTATEPTPGRDNQSFTPVVINKEPLAEEEKPSEDPDLKISNNDFIQEVTDIPATFIALADPEYTEQTIKADAGPDRTVLAGVPFLFSGQGFGITGQALDEPAYFWNFGDGTRAEGKQVVHHYPGPGTYTGTLKVTTGRLSHTDHFIMTVIPPEITLLLSEDSSGLLLQNHSPHTIELTRFSIESTDQKFVFPEGSFISGNSQITLSSDSLGLSFSPSSPINLVASNDQVITTYHGILNEMKRQITIRRESLTQEEPTPPKQETSQEVEQTPEQQIVYIGVPQYIQDPGPEKIQEIEEIPATENTTSFQTATLPPIKRELFSTFEIVLFVLVALGAGIFGAFQLFTYKKETTHVSSIEIEEL